MSSTNVEPGAAAEMAGAYLSTLRGWSCHSGGRARPLVQAFLRAMELPMEAEQAEFFYLGLLRSAVAPRAQALARADGGPLCCALGVEDPDSLLACAVILLFLRDHPPQAGQGALFGQLARFWAGLPEELKARVAVVRRQQLARLRFFLMSDPALAFLATAQPRGEAADDGAPAGYGAARIGVVGYSHLARVVILFALLESLAGGDVVQALAAPPTVDRCPDDLRALYAGVCRSLHFEIAQIERKRSLRVPEVPLDTTGGAGLLAAFGGGATDVWDPAGWTATGSREARRRSSPILAADSGLAACRDGVARVVRAAEERCRDLRSARRAGLVFGEGHGREITFASLLRLHYAFQLMSFLRARHYAAADREQMFRDLERCLGATRRPELGAALAVARSMSARQLFGERFVSRRNRFVREVLEAPGPRRHGLHSGSAVREHLRVLEARGGLRPPAAVCRDGDEAARLHLCAWALARHDEALHPGIRARLDSLLRTLDDEIEARPEAHVRAGLRALSDAAREDPSGRLGHAFACAGFDPAALVRDARRLDAAQGLVPRLLAVVERLEGASGLARERCLCAVVAAVVRAWGSLSAGGHLPPVREVKRFFSMKYAANQPVREQEAWLFVASSLAMEEGLAGYGECFVGISTSVGEWRGPPGQGAGPMTGLYRTLCSRDDWQERVVTPLRSLLQQGEGT